MAADQLALELSESTERDVPFQSTQWQYVLDINAGNYTGGQVILDTTALASSSSYADMQSAYFAIPTRIKVSTGGASLAGGNFLAGLKSGYHNLIHSFMVELNGQTVIQQQPYIGMFNNFRLLTSMSYDALLKDGSEIGFWPDSETSWGFAATTGTSGVGVFNNSDSALSVPLGAAYAGAGASADASFLIGDSNAGFARRQKWVCYNAPANSGHVAAASTANIAQTLKNYLELSSATVNYINIMAIVRLRDLNSLFEKFPMSKGCIWRFTMQLNQSTTTTTLTHTATGDSTINGANADAATAQFGTYTATSVTMPYGGQTNPVMLASGAAGLPVLVGVTNATTLTAGNLFDNGASAVATGNLTVDLRIGGTAWSDGSANSGPFGQSRVQLWVRMVKMDPTTEQAYIAEQKRQISYEDVQQYTLANVTSGSSVTQILFNAVPRLRKLLMVPMVNASSNTINHLLSPFDSAPCTTAPMSHMTNLQVIVSGYNLFQNQVSYNYRIFEEQTRRTGLNFGETPQLCSGLISRDMFDNNYCHHFFNLEPICLPAEDDTGKNVLVQFTSQSALTLDWYCFVAFERRITIDVLSGALDSFM